MIYVDAGRCTGCGICVDVCPHGAISLRGGKASIEEGLCRECETCADACPEGAILSVEEARESSPVASVPVEAVQATPSHAEWMLPAFGSALLWAGREIVPRLASWMLDRADRRAQSRRLPQGRPTAPVSMRRGGSRGHRRRRMRGGR